MEKQNVKDLILLHLEAEERPLAWLSRKTEIPYPTLYSIFIQRIMNLSDKNLEKINEAMGTDFTKSQAISYVQNEIQLKQNNPDDLFYWTNVKNSLEKI